MSVGINIEIGITLAVIVPIVFFVMEQFFVKRYTKNKIKEMFKDKDIMDIHFDNSFMFISDKDVIFEIMLKNNVIEKHRIVNKRFCTKRNKWNVCVTYSNKWIKNY